MQNFRFASSIVLSVTCAPLAACGTAAPDAQMQLATSTGASSTAGMGGGTVPAAVTSSGGAQTAGAGAGAPGTVTGGGASNVGVPAGTGGNGQLVVPSNTAGTMGVAGAGNTAGMGNVGGTTGTAGTMNVAGATNTAGTTGGGGTTGAGGSGSGCGQSGFYVDSGTIYDVNCNPFVMRGVNVAHAWYASNTQSSLADAAAVGANSVRVVLATGGQWTRTDGPTVTNIISWAKANNLVALLEVHDSTGYDESAGAVHPDDAVAYWTSQDILSAIQGQEAYVMINVANEPFGNTQTATWSPFHQSAVQALRNAGIDHLLVVDAPNWGQDWDSVMRDDEGGGVTAIFDADPNKNVVFSVHMYDVYSDAGTVTTYFDNFLAHGLPLIVGEFAADHGSSGDVAETTILAEAQSRGVGYMGWSWSGNSSDLVSLDITLDFDVNNLSSWGTTLIHDTNGIANTSQICTCFN